MLSATAMIRHVNKHIWAGFAATACLAVAAMSAQNNRPPAAPGWLDHLRRRPRRHEIHPTSDRSPRCRRRRLDWTRICRRDVRTLLQIQSAIAVETGSSTSRSWRTHNWWPSHFL